MLHKYLIKKIVIYPIKSLAGISVESAEAKTEGFVNDRRMMLVDESGKFVSQREIPQMVRLKTSFQDDKFVVSDGRSKVMISNHDISSDIETVSVWKSKMKAYSINTEYDQWFSEVLGRKLRLVRMGEKSKRYRKLFKPPFSTYVSFADGYPYLILGTASMAELNNRCSMKMNSDRFRANIIIESQIPHEEDDWSEINLGTARFQNIKPCVRCIMTTIDQQTAVMSKEPLATLSQYRNKNNKILFGSNMVCLTEGIVTVGDSFG